MTGSVACSDTVVGSGPAPEEFDQVVVDYTAVSEATGKIYAGSKGFSFVVGDPASLVRFVHAAASFSELNNMLVVHGALRLWTTRKRGHFIAYCCTGTRAAMFSIGRVWLWHAFLSASCLGPVNCLTRRSSAKRSLRRSRSTWAKRSLFEGRCVVACSVCVCCCSCCREYPMDTCCCKL
jgi:hypothetical protein